MKTMMHGRNAVVVAAACCLIAAADYARQWPLGTTQTDAGAYQLRLNAEVYRQSVNPQLHDVAVLDATGRLMPSRIADETTAAAAAVEHVPLTWFELPATPQRGADDLRVISERSSDGRVLRVEGRAAAAPATSSVNGWLLDASAIRRPISALRLELDPQARIDTGISVEGSDDLFRWNTLASDIRLLQLERDGRQLQQLRVPLDANTRYLRLRMSEGATTLPLRGVQAELGGVAPAPVISWETIRSPSVAKDGRSVEFRLAGRFPVRWVDVTWAGNDATRWRVYSRDAADAQWQLQAGPWTAFRVGTGQQSPPQELALPTRDREWKLEADGAITTSPELKLGYLPESLVFAAAGQAPYVLVAGSSQPVAAAAGIDDLLAELHRQRGTSWSPADATLGSGSERAGAKALQSAPRDWKSIALWGALVLAALLVAGFAVSLLRGREAAVNPPND